MEGENTMEKVTMLANIVGIIGALISAFVLLCQQRTKAKAQVVLLESQRIESQVKLLKTFTELMDIAHARKGTVVIESILSDIKIDMGKLGDDNYSENLKKIIEELAIYSGPVGKGAQYAAIASIYSLAKNNPVLLIPAIKGLESISKFVKEDFVNDYLEDLKKTQLG